MRRGYSQAGRRRPIWQVGVLHFLLLFLSATFLLPLIWLIGSSLKTDDQIRAFPPEWLPDLPHYSSISPYIDAKEFQKALAAGTDKHKALEQARRQLAIGAIIFRGEEETSGSLPQTFEPSSGVGEGLKLKLDHLVGQRSWLIEYEDRGQRRCGQLRERLPWSPSVAEFRTLTLRVHGDRSWREMVLRLYTPEKVFRTNRPILLSFAGWRDILFVRQAEGEIPWGTYRLIEEGVASWGRVSEVELVVEIRSASRIAVILRKLFYNYPSGLTFIPFEKYLFNTLTICALVVIGTLLSCSLVAYGLARINWRGRNVLFYVIIATMMLPFQVTMVPLFVVFARLGWVDSFLPLFVPAFFGNAFFIFLLRQFFMTIPYELTDAARIDGCSEWDIYWRIVLPLAKPALATVGLFAFMNTWNDYVGPLIYLSDASKYTLSLGLATFSSQYGSYPGMLMAVTTVMTVPIIVLFFVAQRTFIQGIALTGIKG
ncbi:MAG: carbohydrate ABC transporter permease [Candidatus Zipacnadales bacterium]